MDKRARQYIGLAAAIVAYYIIHEGAHLGVAAFCGVFKEIRFLGLGIQIDVNSALMSDVQMGIFCLSGAVATLLCGWLLILLCKRICAAKSLLLKAAAWYITLIMLLLDPLYLSVLCGFFGGGDMNGIALLLPEIAARLIFAAIGVLHGVIIAVYVYPRYKAAFMPPAAAATEASAENQ